MRKRTPRLLLGVIVMTTACGGDDDDVSATPAEQCEVFFDALCTKHASCRAPTDRARAREDCLFTLKLDLDCKNVARVSSSYPECLTSISNAQCTANGGISLPASCARVLIAGGL